MEGGGEGGRWKSAEKYWEDPTHTVNTHNHAHTHARKNANHSKGDVFVLFLFL